MKTVEEYQEWQAEFEKAVQHYLGDQGLEWVRERALKTMTRARLIAELAKED